MDEFFQLLQIIQGCVRHQAQLHIRRPPTHPVIALARAGGIGHGPALCLGPGKKIDKVLATGIHQRRYVAAIHDIQPTPLSTMTRRS